ERLGPSIGGLGRERAVEALHLREDGGLPLAAVPGAQGAPARDGAGLRVVDLKLGAVVAVLVEEGAGEEQGQLARRCELQPSVEEGVTRIGRGVDGAALTGP